MKEINTEFHRSKKYAVIFGARILPNTVAWIGLTLIALSICIFLVAVNTSEQRLAKAEALLSKADSAFAAERRDDAWSLIISADEHLRAVYNALPAFLYCRQVYWDEKNLSTWREVLRFRDDLAKLQEKLPRVLTPADREGYGNGVGIIYYNHQSDGGLLQGMAKELERHQCTGIVLRSEYAVTLNKLATVRGDAEKLYEHITGKSWIDAKRKEERAKNARLRADSWYLLTAGERSNIADSDPAVEACISAALSKNTGADGVRNIIRDVAHLCRQGLR